MLAASVAGRDIPSLPHIHQITLPTPFPIGPVHTYLVDGDPLTLIDTGPHTVEAQQALEQGLAAYGVAFGDIQRIIITHAHADHYGQVGILAAASGAEVWAHALARPVIEHWPAYAAVREPFWLDLLLRAGVPADAAEQTARVYRDMEYCTTAAPVAHPLIEGDQLELAGATWEVLYCPGHSDDLVCLFQPQQRLLFGNDHLLSHVSSNAIVAPPLPGTNERGQPLVSYWQSLRRVDALPLDLVLTGHGPAVTDVHNLIDERAAMYERRLARLLAQLQDGPATPWQLANSLFRHLDATDTFLAISEVLGHLDVLENERHVARAQDAAGICWYERC